ncbi:MAG: hypothetical protein JST46_03075 [Bacteroidetes bacterium]|nr:hypothetical protein [Bacteroidota bacterium]
MSNNNKSVLSGMLSESVTVRSVRNQTVIKSRRQPRVSLEGVDRSRQALARARFNAAAQYAKAQISIPESRALYMTGLTAQKRTAYLVAMTDFLHSPETNFTNIRGYRGRIGDAIVINAVDDFKVTKVDVEILDAAGAIIEEGAAVNNPGKPGEWTYAATVVNSNLSGTKLRAIAYDHAGNTGEAEVVL